MPFVPEVTVRGLRELNQALAKADKQTRLGIRGLYRDLARPVQTEAELLAVTRIPRMARSPKWSKMRIGVTQKLVYVAPRQRGIRRQGHPGKRPNLADLMMDRAMEPALEHNRPFLEAETERMLDRIANDFNHAGPV